MGTHAVTVPLAWKEAVQRTREALAGQEFGILSEIDVRAIFEARSGSAADAVGDYVILRACSPVLASRALAVEPDLGALMPCHAFGRAAPTGRLADPAVESMRPKGSGRK